MLLDIWWDPAMYEQMHMQWEHKEQDALETLYSTQAWIERELRFTFTPNQCVPTRRLFRPS